MKLLLMSGFTFSVLVFYMSDFIAPLLFLYALFCAKKVYFNVLFGVLLIFGYFLVVIRVLSG